MRSKRSLWVAGTLVLLATLGGAWSTLSAQGFQVQPGPPPGVAPASWISISGSLGFVIQRQQPQARDLSGYFMVRHQGTWWHVTSAGQLQHLNLSP